MKNLLTFGFIILLTLGACGSKFDSSLLPGKWLTEKWINKTDLQEIDSKMTFEFMEDGRYTMNVGSRIEEGKYWIFGESLHTVEDGKSEKTVKILRLTNQELIFEMNRYGQIEEVILRRG